MDLDTVVYLGASSVMVVLIITGASNYGLLAVPVVVLGLIVLLLLFMLNFADFVLFPFVAKYLDMEIMLSKDHRVPKAQNCVLKYVNGLYYATGYLTANVYKYVFASEGATSEEELGMADAPDKWEGIIMNTGFPFKFNLVSVAEEVQKYREELEGQRGFLEFQLSKENNASTPNQLTILEIQRKISVVQARIDRISSGEFPTYSLMYIETTAVGVSEKEATDFLAEQLSHLQTVFGTFNLSISRIVGRELHIIHGLNYRLMSIEEMSHHFQEQT